MSILTTLKQPIEAQSYSTVFDENKTRVVNPARIVKIVFIPEGLTPLDVYEAELLKNGYSIISFASLIE